MADDASDALLKLLVLHVLSEAEDETPKNPYIGLRVVRGPDWKWDNQDGGEGHVGTVVEISSTHEKTVAVQWDCGYRGWYRVGANGAYDLRTLDSASVGVKHETITCNSCWKKNMFGIRWKCDSCFNYDLCSPCYMSDKHDVSHSFLRIGMDDTPRVRIPKREGATKVPMRGIFASALVVRGADWKWDNQDGGNGKTGIVEYVREWDDKADRDAVEVWWISETSLRTYTYRLGYKGKMDLKCVKDAVDGTYYREHLPVLGDEMREIRLEESGSTFATRAESQKGLLSLSESMQNSFLSAKFSDLTIKVKERVFPVHKFILCVRSSVFESMIRNSGTVLEIPDCDPEVFENVLYYVYTGTLKLSAHVHIDELHNLAQRFNIPALKLECDRVKISAARDSFQNFIAAA